MDAVRLTKEEWDDLEPRLVEAERAAHEHFMQSAETQAVMGASEHTPGYVLLQRLKQLDDPAMVQFFRATEMYHHEITRADIAVAYARGKEVGAGGK
ncbi:MAG: hypothetical protein ABSD48_07305 [Armatimonadota bacterium]|jgi:tyrosyl-tRNA synthetase